MRMLNFTSKISIGFKSMVLYIGILTIIACLLICIGLIWKIGPLYIPRNHLPDKDLFSFSIVELNKNQFLLLEPIPEESDMYKYCFWGYNYVNLNGIEIKCYCIMGIPYTGEDMNFTSTSPMLFNSSLFQEAKETEVYIFDRAKKKKVICKVLKSKGKLFIEKSGEIVVKL